MKRLRTSLVATVALLVACALSLESPEIETAAIGEETRNAASEAFGALFASYDRVLGISGRLRLANLESCSSRSGGYLGWMVFADRDFGTHEIRELASQVVQVGRTPVVVALSSGGPAGRAGVQIGDEIVSIGSKRPLTHVQVRRAEQQLATKRSSVALRRGGRELMVEVDPAIACRYEAMPVGIEGMQAWPTLDGNVAVTISLVEAATDDELAYLIAHAFALQRLEVDVRDLTTPLPEPEATDLAIEMCERAGFDVSSVDRIIELQAIEQPWLIFGIPNRFVALRWRPRGPIRVGELPRRIVALRTALSRREAR